MLRGRAGPQAWMPNPAPLEKCATCPQGTPPIQGDLAASTLVTWVEQGHCQAGHPETTCVLGAAVAAWGTPARRRV